MRPALEGMSRGTARLARAWSLFIPLVLVVLLWKATALTFLGAAWTALLLGLLPVLAVAQASLVKREEVIPRLPVYLSSGVFILALGWGGWAVGKSTLGSAGMGLSPLRPDEMVWASLLLTGGGGAIVCAFWLFRRALGIRESPLLVLLLPRSAVERGVFAVLSLVAGVGEEVAYRGYLVPTLLGVLGHPWLAVAVSSAAFGALHAYQGWLGIARTASLGALLALGFLATGSLWPAVAAHATLDLLAGLGLGERFLKG